MRHLLIMSVGLLMLGLASLIYGDGELAPATNAYKQSLRIAGDVDSWSALCIVIVSFVTAWALNYSAPKVRVFGTVLAALGCLAVTVWFFSFVTYSGVLQDPKANQTPLDSAKPMLLWLQACVALLAGLLLLLAAKRQAASNSEEIVVLAATNEQHQYGRVSRVLHWATALFFLALIPAGIFSSMIPEDHGYRNAYYVVHKTLGVVIFLLLLIRLAWNRVSQPPSLDPALTSLERKLAGAAHTALYLMLLCMPVTGFMMTSYHGYPTYFFIWELPPLWTPSDAYIIWGALHKYLLPYLLYIVLGAHILGVLTHHFIDQHSRAVKRMVG